MSALLSECVLGCKTVKDKKILVKNRDRTYDSEVALVHHLDDETEYLILFDPKTKYIEGYNATSGVAIMNVALMNGTDFAAEESDEGKNIFRAILNAKDAAEAAKILVTKGQKVFGITLITDRENVLTLEQVPNKKPIAKKRNLKRPLVLTNHSLDLDDAGYTPEHDDDYISSKTRQATSEVMLSNAQSAEDILNALNYPFFGSHSAFDPVRDTSGMRTCSQMSIEPEENVVTFRVIPGRGSLMGVYKTGNWNKKPVIRLDILEYEEPHTVPFETWGSSFDSFVHEGFDLARLLDPEDPYSDLEYFSDVEKEHVKTIGPSKSVDYYIDKENEIIRMIVSLHNLLKNSNPSMMHLMKDRSPQKDRAYINSLLQDAEKSTMDLYNLKSALRSQQKEKNRKSEAFLRKYIQGILQGSSKEPTLK